MEQHSKDWNQFSPEALEQVEINIKYSGYVGRQTQEIKLFQELEKIKLPESIHYDQISGLSLEVIEKLKSFRPVNLAQASRISGLTPAAISVLRIYLKNIKSNHKLAS